MTDALYPSGAPQRAIGQHRRRDSTYKALPNGISFDRTRLRYRARVTFDGRQYHGGWFNNVADAVAARNRLAVQLYGSDARLVPVRVTETAARARVRGRLRP